MQCTAKSKRSQQQCKRGATPGKDKCYIHGGKTPIKMGLYSKYPNVIADAVSPHIEAAQAEDGIELLRQTIPIVAAILSTWIARGSAFLTSEASATAVMLGRLTKMVETYEKLTNPKLRNGKLEVTHEFKDKTNEDLVNETQALIAEAESVCRGAAARS